MNILRDSPNHAQKHSHTETIAFSRLLHVPSTIAFLQYPDFSLSVSLVLRY